jgi:hypothetical protein
VQAVLAHSLDALALIVPTKAYSHAAGEAHLLQLEFLVGARQHASLHRVSCGQAVDVHGPCLPDTVHAVHRLRYSDEKVANREIRVWHFVLENGY